MKIDTYTFDEIATVFVRKASRYVAYRYRFYGVTSDDVSQEIYVWLYGEGKRKVEKWLSSSPQQTTRIYRSMLDKGISYGEKEKAAKVGYEVDDVAWYTESSIEALLPLALDPVFTGTVPSDPDTARSNKPPQEGGDLLVMALDVRKAVEKLGLVPFFVLEDPDHPQWRENVRKLLDYLGGARPHVGRRRAMSNAQAQAITRSQE